MRSTYWGLAGFIRHLCDLLCSSASLSRLNWYGCITLATMTNQVIHGNCMDILPNLADKSVFSVITDPPYGIKLDTWDIPVNIPLFTEHAARLSTGFYCFFGQMPRPWLIGYALPGNLCSTKIMLAGLNAMLLKPMGYREGMKVFLLLNITVATTTQQKADMKM